MKAILGCLLLGVSVSLIRIDTNPWWMLMIGGILLLASIVLISDARIEDASRKLKK